MAAVSTAAEAAVSWTNNFARIFFGTIIGILALNAVINKLKARDENLDFSFTAAPRWRARRTRPGSCWSSSRRTIRRSRRTFWRARRRPHSCCSSNAGRRAITTPMKPLLMPDLYAEHVAQIQGMIRDHEINMIEDLQRRRGGPRERALPERWNGREFTALISASARDTTSTTGRGNSCAATRSPRRSRSSGRSTSWTASGCCARSSRRRSPTRSRTENFFEPFTDHGVKQVYAETAGREGPAGPSRWKPVRN